MGKERDEESGLYYHGARYYIPWLCRWSASDPLESKYVGWSPYNYGNCNPVTFNDPSGMGGEDTVVNIKDKPWHYKNDTSTSGIGNRGFGFWYSDSNGHYKFVSGEAAKNFDEAKFGETEFGKEGGKYIGSGNTYDISNRRHVFSSVEGLQFLTREGEAQPYKVLDRVTGDAWEFDENGNMISGVSRHDVNRTKPISKSTGKQTASHEVASKQPEAKNSKPLSSLELSTFKTRTLENKLSKAKPITNDQIGEVKKYYDRALYIPQAATEFSVTKAGISLSHATYSAPNISSLRYLSKVKSVVSKGGSLLAGINIATGITQGIFEYNEEGKVRTSTAIDVGISSTLLILSFIPVTAPAAWIVGLIYGGARLFKADDIDSWFNKFQLW